MITTLNDHAFKLLKNNRKDLHHKNYFTFVYLSDTRGTTRLNPINKKIFKEILDQIYKLQEIPTFVLHGGDIAFQGTNKNLHDFKNMIISHPINTHKNIPFFTIPGNHEVYQPNIFQYQWDLKNFHQIIGADRFLIKVPISSFKFQVLAENNITDLKPYLSFFTHYGFSEKTIQLMERTIKNNKGRSIIAFHTPPRLACWKHSMGKEETNRFIDNVVKKQANKIPLILTSHIHGFGREKKGKTTYMISGGGGAPLSILTKCVTKVFHFVEFRVYRSSIIAVVYWRNQSGKWVKTPSFRIQ